MMEATTDPVPPAVEKSLPRDVSDDDLFKPRNQPTTEAIMAPADNGVEKRDVCKEERGGEAEKDVDDSDASSPEPQQPLQPKFNVRFTDEVIRNGDIISYRIEVTKTAPPHTCHYILRQYEELECLEQCLTAGNRSPGLIVPPLPPRPTFDPHEAELRCRRQLGDASPTMLVEDWQRDCRQMERYLRLLIEHEVFGRDPQLERFLTSAEPPASSLARKSLLSRLSEGLQASRATHPDCDEFFQRERVWLHEHQPALRLMSEAFNRFVDAQQRLSNQLNHLATAFNIGVGTNEGVSGLYHKLNVRFSDALREYKRGIDLSATSSDGTLGQTLELFARYAQSEAEMLHRRTGLMIEYETANRSLEKNRQQRRGAVEETKRQAEAAFEECSDTAREEIRRLHRLRTSEILNGIHNLARAQIHSAQILQADLSKHVERLRQFPTPEPGHSVRTS